LTSSGGEGNDDEDLSFSEPPLDDEDDEPLTRPSSGFTPTPQPLTSTEKSQGQDEDRKPIEKKETDIKQGISLVSFCPNTHRMFIQEHRKLQNFLESFKLLLSVAYCLLNRVMFPFCGFLLVLERHTNFPDVVIFRFGVKVATDLIQLPPFIIAFRS